MQAPRGILDVVKICGRGIEGQTNKNQICQKRQRWILRSAGDKKMNRNTSKNNADIDILSEGLRLINRHPFALVCLLVAIFVILIFYSASA
jgi:hypothetical protein